MVQSKSRPQSVQQIGRTKVVDDNLKFKEYFFLLSVYSWWFFWSNPAVAPSQPYIHVCVIYGFLVNHGLLLFLLSGRFATPSQKEWHYSCCGATAINVMSQAVNVIQTQRCSLNLSFFSHLQTGDLCALHNNDVMCHRWFILPLNLLVMAPSGIAFKRKAQRWNECSVPNYWETCAKAKGF